MTDKIVPPLVPGLNFKHVDGSFTVEVQEIHQTGSKGVALVKVCGCEEWSVPWQEEWNLAHTINGFKDGTYVALGEKDE